MCNSGSLLHNLQIPPPPRPRRNFLLTSPFFRRTRILPQSSVRARAGHRPCSVKPAKSTRENFPKDSQRVRRQNDYVNKKFRRGPTHPRVAHSCLSTLGFTVCHTQQIGIARPINTSYRRCWLRKHVLSDSRRECVISLPLGPGIYPPESRERKQSMLSSGTPPIRENLNTCWSPMSSCKWIHTFR